MSSIITRDRDLTAAALNVSIADFEYNPSLQCCTFRVSLYYYINDIPVDVMWAHIDSL